MILGIVIVVVSVVLVVGVCMICEIICWSLLVLVVWLLVLWIVSVGWLPWWVRALLHVPRILGGLLVWALDLWSCGSGDWVSMLCGCCSGRVG